MQTKTNGAMKIYEVTIHTGAHGFNGQTSTFFMKGSNKSGVELKARQGADVKSVKLRKDMSIDDFEEEGEFGDLKFTEQKNL